MLYLRTSQVVVFLHLSWKIVAFGDNTAPQPERQAAQRQSIPHSPTMGLRAWEDILTKERSNPKNTATAATTKTLDRLKFRSIQTPDELLRSFSSLDVFSKRNIVRKETGKKKKKICGALQSFSVPNSFLPAISVRSRRDPGKFLHYPSSSCAPGSYTRRILTSKQQQNPPFVAISAEKGDGVEGKSCRFRPPPTSKNSS